MKILKYICFALVILNLPSITLVTFGPGLGSLLSHVTVLLLVVYYFFEKKTEPNWWLLLITLFYFLISGLQFSGETNLFLYELIKYSIFVICGFEMTKHITINELYVFFIIGTLSIGVEALFFTSKFGRYSGFYLNPNVAGFICIYGYSIVYGMKNTTLKLIGQFVFTLMGFLTFSRTFIVIWLLLNLLSLKISIKNIRMFGVAFLIFSTLFFIDETVGLNNPRFEQLKSIVNNENVSTEEINENSRTETWALFYDQILEAPLFGNGYGYCSGKLGTKGVHNSYLMIIGEAGIIPFFIFISLIIYIIYWSILLFKYSPNLIMQTIAVTVFLLTNHNFFTFYYITFALMWIQYQIVVQKESQFNNTNNSEA